MINTRKSKVYINKIPQFKKLVDDFVNIKFGKFSNVKKLTKDSKSKPSSGKIIYFIFFLAFSSSIFFAFKRYLEFVDNKVAQYQRISSHLASEYEGVLNYSQLLLNSVSQEILKSKSIGVDAYKVLSSIDRIRNQNNIANQIFYESMLYWIDSNKYLIASSAGKVLKPIDLSSRDYLEKTQIDPWKLKVGKVITGAISGNNILPVAIGVVGEKGHHLGTSVLSIKLENLVDKLSLAIGKNKFGKFAIIDADGKIILQSHKKYFALGESILVNLKNRKFNDNSIVVKPFKIFKRSGNFVVASKVIGYPFIVLYGVDNNKIYQELFIEILPYLVQILFLLVVLASYLSLSRVVYKPSKKYY